MRLPRVMSVGEASFLSTGFSTYTHEVLKRLYATGKYELFELGNFAPADDPRWQSVYWPCAPVMPPTSDHEAMRRYESSHAEKFGEGKFEEACLVFKPDIVWSIRDPWMDAFIGRSPFRERFYFSHMPTVDALDLDKEWLALYQEADAVFSYTDWGLSVLKDQAGGANIKCSAPAGADFEAYQVRPDRDQLRKKVGLFDGCLIVGTVMRNQARKLYPDLFEGFSLFLKEAPKELADKAFLYVHAGWPDVGWDFPRLLLEYELGHKVIFTYCCRKCGSIYPNFFQDSVAICRNCGEKTAFLPSSQHGVDNKILGSVYALMDVYCQLSCCEGLGMPQIEAAACGVPIMSVDYSAMSDVVRKLYGTPIRVQRFFRDVHTHRKFALPDLADFSGKLIELLSLPESARRALGFRARKAVEEHYTWDRTAKTWEQHFDEAFSQTKKEPWNGPAKLFHPADSVPDGMGNEDFVRWAFCNVAGRPDLANSYLAVSMSRDLNWGATLGFGVDGRYQNEASALGVEPRFGHFNRNHVLNICYQMCQVKNHWETRRVQQGR